MGNSMGRATNANQQTSSENNTLPYPNYPTKPIVYKQNTYLTSTIRYNDGKSLDSGAAEIAELTPEEESKFYRSIRKSRRSQ